MAQLSRPYQIALGAVLLFAVVWFVALDGHGSSSGSTPVASTPAPTPAPAAQEKAVASSKVYHGAAPGLEGLTRDIDRAHRAVAKTQGQEQKIAGAAGEAKSQGTGASSSATAVTKHAAASASAAVTTTKHAAAPVPHKTATSGIPAQQATIESELKRGEVAVILFWNKKGADDKVVHEELQVLTTIHRIAKAHDKQPAVAHILKVSELEFSKPIAVHYATAAQVASFGSFTRGVQVYGTPTILIVNKRGQTTTLTGLQDYYSIEQTIDEARQES